MDENKQPMVIRHYMKSLTKDDQITNINFFLKLGRKLYRWWKLSRQWGCIKRWKKKRGGGGGGGVF